MNLPKKVHIIVKALWLGLPITFPDGYKYYLVKDENDNYVLCTKIKELRSGEERFVKSDYMTFDFFLKDCDKLSDDEVFAIGADIVLNEEKRYTRNG